MTPCPLEEAFISVLTHKIPQNAHSSCSLFVRAKAVLQAREFAKNIPKPKLAPKQVLGAWCDWGFWCNMEARLIDPVP